MNDIQAPYFIMNKEWYYYDKKKEIYKLTSKAPKEAKKSYEEFYKDLEKRS